jgi:hypothetical protein
MFSSGIVLSQAVVRVKRYSYKNSSSKIIFYYNRTVFAGIRPLELSFIQVHEWLWNFTNDINAIRRINYFIHSNLFDEYSAQETKEFFKQFNLNINLDR